jgi:spore coat polysaccharide biosynthesis protein SpsF
VHVLMNRVLIIIQARMKSTRLPGKVLSPLQKVPMVLFLVKHLVPLRIPLLVATTNDPSDEVLCQLLIREKIPYYRGDMSDVLDRYVQALDGHECDAIVRLTADCPLHDPQMVRRAIALFLDQKVDYLSNTIKRTFPRGYDIEVIAKEALMRAQKEAKEDYQREHVTPYIIEHPELFSLAQFYDSIDRSAYRLTVDTEEDYHLVERVVDALKDDYSYKNVIRVLEKHPEWAKINHHVKQKSLR